MKLKHTKISQQNSQGGSVLARVDIDSPDANVYPQNNAVLFGKPLECLMEFRCERIAAGTARGAATSHLTIDQLRELVWVAEEALSLLEGEEVLREELEAQEIERANEIEYEMKRYAEEDR